MTFDNDAIARRFAVRPGCRFVGYKAVGISVFQMDLRVLAIEPRQIPPLEEFIIRLLHEGIACIDCLSSLLGIDDRLIRDRLIELRRKECVEVLGTEDSDEDIQCVLTVKGQELAQTLRQTEMQEVTVPNVIFHGLLRVPVQQGSQSRRLYLKPKEAKDSELTLIRALPNRYPRPDEISLGRLDQIVKRDSRVRRSDSQLEIVAVKSLLKKVFTLYESAVMLEFETDDNRRERQVAFAVDGNLRDEYELAFANARGTEVLVELMTQHPEPLPVRIQRDATEQTIERLGKLDDVEDLAARHMATQQALDDAKRDLDAADRSDTRHVQAERIRFLERENAQIAAERDSRKVKFLWTPEIRAKFREAIETARERLLILSGFISSDVVNEQFETSLRNALNRGVRVWIGYGFDKESRRGEDQRAQPGWLEAENVFKRLKNEFPECFIYRDLQRSHEKRLICDNRFTFGGSFNLLSFSGEARRNRKLRHEGADLIEDAAYCDEQFDWYQRLFFS